MLLVTGPKVTVLARQVTNLAQTVMPQQWTRRTSDPSDQCPFGPVTCPHFMYQVIEVLDLRPGGIQLNLNPKHPINCYIVPALSVSL